MVINSKLRLVISMILFLCCNLSVWADEKKVEVKDKSPEAVGERFTAALASEDADAAKKCWIQWSMMENITKNLPATAKVPAMEQIKERHKIITENVDKFLPELIAKIKGVGVDIKSLTHDKTVAEVKERDGLKVVSKFRVISKDKNNIEVEVTLDDGILYEGTWYTIDIPKKVVVTKDGKPEIIQIEAAQNRKK
jgi:hypothetical protein